MAKGKPKANERPMDDNIDDLGRKPDGSYLDQPRTVVLPPRQPTPSEPTPDKKDVVPGSDADSNDQSLGV